MVAGRVRRKKRQLAADDLYIRLSEGGEINDNLPEEIEWQSDPDLACRVFYVLEAVDYQWTIADVLAQPEALLNDVLMIASLHRRMKRLKDKAEHG